MRQVTAYQTEDGQIFSTEKEALAHEAKDPFTLIERYTSMDFRAAVELKDGYEHIGDAIETLARMRQRNRLKAGIRRRKPKVVTAPDNDASAQQAAAE